MAIVKMLVILNAGLEYCPRSICEGWSICKFTINESETLKYIESLGDL